LEQNVIGAIKEEKEKAIKSLLDQIKEKDLQLKQQFDNLAVLKH
jgi:hypothetical protein